jgi:hypothetical protein
MPRYETAAEAGQAYFEHLAQFVAIYANTLHEKGLPPEWIALLIRDWQTAYLSGSVYAVPRRVELPDEAV